MVVYGKLENAGLHIDAWCICTCVELHKPEDKIPDWKAHCGRKDRQGCRQHEVNDVQEA